MKSARQIAVETLLRVGEGGAWSNRTLDALIEKNGLSRRDGALATALTYGVLERRLTLDACIAAHSKTRPEKLSPVVREILRVTVYQLLYLEKIPDHAAVDEAVELAKTLRMAKAAGFVNGVLRSFLRAGKEIPLPVEPEEEQLAVMYSVPAPLIRLWQQSYGAARTGAILEAGLVPAPLYLRVNTLRTTASALVERLAGEGVEAAVSDFLPACVVVSGQGALHKMKAYEDGLFHIQDSSSQLCALALGVAPGMAVLDACAAPGGKAFILAQEMENTGRLVATELHSQRVALMEKQAKRLGITNLTARQADMTSPPPDLGVFDRILVDAPCSGLGVMRRKPEIKYKPLEEFAELPEIQYRILCAASHYLQGGGKLLYATCTLHPPENEEVVARFLREHPGFAPSPLPAILNPDGKDWQRTLTAERSGDHFYMALLERKQP
jgi:16S rRNA (cytosine967-C5)-methyltransferase